MIALMFHPTIKKMSISTYTHVAALGAEEASTTAVELVVTVLFNATSIVPQ
jgi:hypothetical protein